jgi:hypothetical protein
LADVKVNGKTCGIVRCPPFRGNITNALQSSENQPDVKVVNFWPNRFIGDASLPTEQRRARTNIRELTKDSPHMPSGLLGPVELPSPCDPSHRLGAS